MKFSANRAELSEALTVIVSVAPQRTPKDVLKCVLVEATDDYLTLSATDLEIGVRMHVSQVEIESSGAMLVPAAKLGDIVRESEDEVLKLEYKNDVCHLYGSGSHFQVFGQDVKGFPSISQPGDGISFEIEADTLLQMSRWTVFAAARESTRYAINGVLWDKKGNELNLVATDGRRLSKASHRLSPGDEDCSAIVPTKAMQLFSRILDLGTSAAEITVSPSQIVLKCAKATVTASLLEGNFPSYSDVIPEDSDKRVELQTQVWLTAVRQAALLTNAESKGVRLAFSSGTLTLSSRAPEQGEAVISVEIDYDNGDVEIGFNPVFLTDVLRVVSGERVTFEFKEANRPGIFRSGDDFLCVIMPVSLA